jgi:hypothetical protein
VVLASRALEGWSEKSLVRGLSGPRDLLPGGLDLLG